MIDRSHLAIFKTLNDCGTLAETANALCLTQSALSHAVKKLEHQLGVQLWQKQGRRLRLTPAGEYLLAAAQRLLPQMDEVDAKLKSLGQGKAGCLRIGMECHPCYEWLLTVVSPFLSRWPQVDLDVVQRFRFNGIQALSQHQVDMVISSDPIEDQAFVFQPVLNYELLLLSHPDGFTTKRQYVTPNDLRQQLLLTFPVDKQRLDVFTQFLDPANTQPLAHKNIETTEIMLQLVASGRGVCTLPDWLAKKFQLMYDLRTFSLGAGGVHKQLFLIYRREDSQLAYLQDFLAIATPLS